MGAEEEDPPPLAAALSRGSARGPEPPLGGGWRTLAKMSPFEIFMKSLDAKSIWYPTFCSLLRRLISFC